MDQYGNSRPIVNQIAFVQIVPLISYSWAYVILKLLYNKLIDLLDPIQTVCESK
jgi:hypothetical protein